MTLLWIYNLPLKPESGGTERITSLVAKGFSLRGYHCMDILVFDEQYRNDELSVGIHSGFVWVLEEAQGGYCYKSNCI